MKEIKVHLSTQEKAYNIEFPKDFNSLDERLLKQISGRNFLLVTDENVFEKSPFFNSKVRSFQSPTLLKNILVLPPGEIYKTWETVEKILNSGFERYFEDRNGNAQTIQNDRILVAVGRRPFSENAGLQGIGISIENNGVVAVDNRFQTNVPGIYAIGDLIRGPMLAHKAEETHAA